MASPRVACAGCGRSIAVVSNAGRLARHRCIADDGQPVALTPAGALALARQREAAIRGRILATEASIARQRQQARLARAIRYVDLALVVVNLVNVIAFGPSTTVGALWVVAAALAVVAWRTSTLARSGLARDERALERQREHYAAAHADMLELEAGNPTAVVWPELYPINPEDTPS